MTGQIVRRKRYLIAPRFQLKYSLFFLLSALSAAGILGAVGYAFFRSAQLHVTEAYIQVPPELRDYLETSLKELATAILVLLLALSALLLSAGILATHRIAGPLARLRRAMDRIAEGDLSERLVPREGDDFPELSESFNRMAEHLDSR